MLVLIQLPIERNFCLVQPSVFKKIFSLEHDSKYILCFYASVFQEVAYIDIENDQRRNKSDSIEDEKPCLKG